MNPSRILSLLLLVGAASASDPGQPIRIKRCAKAFDVTLEVAGSGQYTGEWCIGVAGTFVLGRNPPEPPYDSVAVDPGPADATLGFVVVDRQEPGDVLWRADKAPHRTGRYPLVAASRKESAVLVLQEAATPDSTRVFIHAVDQTHEAVRDALVSATDMRVSGDFNASNRISLDFAAIDAHAVLELLASDAGRTLRWSADGSATVMVAGDVSEQTSITQELNDGIDPEDREAKGKALSRLRDIARYSTGKSLAPDSWMWLNVLAQYYIPEDDVPSLIALRRDLMRYALDTDARPKSTLTALTRADLADALLSADADSAEARQLLEASTPVLLGHLPRLSDAAQLHRIGRALHRSGQSAIAEKFLTRVAFDAAPGDSLLWHFEAEPAVNELLLLYRTSGETAKFDAAAKRWRERTLDTAYQLPVHRAQELRALADSGRFIEAASAADVLIAMMPPLDRVGSDTVHYLLREALFLHVSAGRFTSAAEILRLNLRIARTRGAADAADSARLAHGQAILDALAKDRDEPVMSSRYRTRESVDNREDGYADFMADALLLAQMTFEDHWTDLSVGLRKPNSGDLDAMEAWILVGAWDRTGVFNRSAAMAAFKSLQDQRRASGESVASLAKRQQTFEVSLERLAQLPAY